MASSEAAERRAGVSVSVSVSADAEGERAGGGFSAPAAAKRARGFACGHRGGLNEIEARIGREKAGVKERRCCTS